MHIQPPKLEDVGEIVLRPQDAKILREGTALRIAIVRMGTKILEVFVSPVWDPPYGYGDGKPTKFEVEDTEFSEYTAEGKLIFRGHSFPIVLKD